MTELQLEIVPLAVAFVLSSIIGFERELRHKVAGLRTHAMVGMGAAVIMLISKYGFDDILRPGMVVLNPAQLAGQIVSGIGFLGAGIIFVRRESARGLITAASIWLVAAIGMAAGAGLYTLAVAATVGDLLITILYTPVIERLRDNQNVLSEISLTYEQGTGVLRQAMSELTRTGCTVESLNVTQASGASTDVCVLLEVRGSTPVAEVASNLAQIQGVVAARTSSAALAHSGR
ncbi:MgtC/SapB family protein [Jatrophihabitans sp. DSM 45814]